MGKPWENHGKTLGNGGKPWDFHRISGATDHMFHMGFI